MGVEESRDWLELSGEKVEWAITWLGLGCKGPSWEVTWLNLGCTVPHWRDCGVESLGSVGDEGPL